MADNVPITQGSGTTIATDDVGGVHYQKVKPVFGGDDTVSPPDTNAGNASAGSQRVVIATDQAKLPVHGDVAHDGADAGSPVKVGGKAVSADPTAVATGDRADFITDLIGRLVTSPYAIPENSLDGIGSATDTSDTSIIAAQGAGIRIYVTTIIVSNSSATNAVVTIKSGTTSKLVVPAPAVSGAVINLPRPLRLTANEALQFASGTAVSTISVSAVGYKGA